MFNALGSEAVAGRAERERLATRERVRKRSVETRDELTTQEAQIARLTRDGLSNVLPCDYGPSAGRGPATRPDLRVSSRFGGEVAA
jgi:hypothetical protein